MPDLGNREGFKFLRLSVKRSRISDGSPEKSGITSQRGRYSSVIRFRTRALRELTPAAFPLSFESIGRTADRPENRGFATVNHNGKTEIILNSRSKYQSKYFTSEDNDLTDLQGESETRRRKRKRLGY